jgi:hypothetical protein
MQRRIVAPCRRFGTTYRPILRRSSSPWRWDWQLSRNVGTELPFYAKTNAHIIYTAAEAINHPKIRSLLTESCFFYSGTRLFFNIKWPMRCGLLNDAVRRLHRVDINETDMWFRNNGGNLLSRETTLLQGYTVHHKFAVDELRTRTLASAVSSRLTGQDTAQPDRRNARWNGGGVGGSSAD